MLEKAFVYVLRSVSDCTQKLVKHKLLTVNESQVTQTLANYLSQAGVHALSSEPEHVRVCRTTVIEWTMMIAGRLEQRLTRT